MGLFSKKTKLQKTGDVLGGIGIGLLAAGAVVGQAMVESQRYCDADRARDLPNLDTFAGDDSLAKATQSMANGHFSPSHIARKVQYEQGRLGSIRLALAKVQNEDRDAKRAVKEIIENAERGERTGFWW